MTSENIIASWCCLNPNERNITVFAAGLWVTNPIFMDRAIFDGVWDATVTSSRLERRETYTISWSLTPGIFIDPDGNPQEVYYFDLLTWAPLAAFALNPINACTAQCKQITFSQ